MTCKPIWIFCRTVAMSPALGVIPPSTRSQHNSTRCAPPRSAATAESVESMQISTMMGMVDGIVYQCGQDGGFRGLPPAQSQGRYRGLAVIISRFAGIFVRENLHL